MNKDLLEISDGKLYGNNDMAKISCHDCAGCSSCCRDMGESIWLDPYDIFQLTRNLCVQFVELLSAEENQKSVEEMKQEAVFKKSDMGMPSAMWQNTSIAKVELHVEDGLILPNLRMIGEGEPCCGFLNEEGRCSIHAFRPGLCRLFPLGRNYEDGRLTYFVLKDACPAPSKSKIKINKWLGIPRIKEYEKFLVEWHDLTKMLRAYYEEHHEEDAVIKTINMKFLEIFYLTPYVEDDFYQEFYGRLDKMKRFLENFVSPEIFYV